MSSSASSPALLLAGLALLLSAGHLTYALTSSPSEADTPPTSTTRITSPTSTSSRQPPWLRSIHA